MEKLKKLTYSIIVGATLVLVSCSDPIFHDPVAYAIAEFQLSTPVALNPTGSSSIASLALGDINGSFDSNQNAFNISDASFTLNMKRPSMVQLAVETTGSSADGVFTVSVGDTQIGTLNVDLNYVYSHDSTNYYKFGVYKIPKSKLVSGNNSIKIQTSSGGVYVKDIKFLPRDIYSDSGDTLSTTFFTQFSETDLVKGTDSTKIWTRAYGLSNEIEMIPGPTLYFKPGDLVSVKMFNLLNPDSSDALNTFEQIHKKKLSNPDEQLIPAALRGEINVPHNLNNTNLHVHGLHVDPSKDDVTIVIVPQGADTTKYDAPHSGHPVSHLDSLNEYSVADQAIKPGIWDYEYKIPESHLPGTHWFHPHKHGSTSAQVENGLAGTIVIQENLENSVIKFSSTQDMEAWQDQNDLVFSIQQITNYGLQLGEGTGKGSITPVALDLTVNGDTGLVVNLNKGQLQRWRMVNAGTNHRSFGHLWLGKYLNVDPTYNLPVYQSTDIYLVAVDGITLPQLDTVHAASPALLAPGNRSDFLVQLQDKGTYTLFKNYSLSGKPDIIIQDKNGNVIYNPKDSSIVFYPASTSSKNNPYFFSHGKKENNYVSYLGFTQNWKTPTTKNPNKTSNLSVAPLIRTKVINNQFLDVDFNTIRSLKKGSMGWQPVQPNGQIKDGKLFDAVVSDVAATNVPSFPTKERLKKISAVGMGNNAPSYVSTIDSADILQSRPVVFDVSGLAVRIDNRGKSTDGATRKDVNQFTLNGRFFILNDPVGNTKSDSLIKRFYISPNQLEYALDSATLKDDSITLSFVNAGTVAWPNTNMVNGKQGYYFTNPGYYQTLTGNNTTGWSWSQTGMPSWELISGIPNNSDGTQQSAIINTQSKFYSGNDVGNYLPNLPLAQTAEEWILINNSDVSHPFHIHINPFFVVEVGQLSYENGDWYMRSVRAPGETPLPEMPKSGAVPGTVYQGALSVDGIVGNWWDTIIIPAHGYVKVRYWFNVPNQYTDSSGGQKVTDNYNKVGIWVYHCHILRHEDRGMMMPVITQKTKHTK